MGLKIAFFALFWLSFTHIHVLNSACHFPAATCDRALTTVAEYGATTVERHQGGNRLGYRCDTADKGLTPPLPNSSACPSVQKHSVWGQWWHGRRHEGLRA